MSTMSTDILDFVIAGKVICGIKECTVVTENLSVSTFHKHLLYLTVLSYFLWLSFLSSAKRQHKGLLFYMLCVYLAAVDSSYDATGGAR